MRPLRKLQSPRSTPDLQEVKQAYEANRFHFILAELELAITFAESAVSSASAEKSSRNLRHAKRAYQAAKKFLKDSSFSSQMMQAVEEKVDRLHVLLKRLRPTT